MANNSGDDRRFQGPEGEWFEGGNNQSNPEQLNHDGYYHPPGAGSAQGNHGNWTVSQGQSQEAWSQPAYLDTPPPWGAPPQQEMAGQAPKKRGKVFAAVTIFIGLAILAAGGGIWLVGYMRGPSLEAVAEKCENTTEFGLLANLTGLKETVEELPGLYEDYEEIGIWDMTPEFISVASDESSLAVNNQGLSVDKVDMLSGLRGDNRDTMETFVDQWNGVRDLSILAAVNCIHDELDLPDSVANRMGSTRALDGVQEVSHSGINITWNYHPSRGLDVIYEKD